MVPLFYLLNSKLVILDDFEVPTVKTGQLNKVLQTRGWDNVLFVDGAEVTPYFFLASRNIPNAVLLPQHK
jgi:ribosomal protein L4